MTPTDTHTGPPPPDAAPLPTPIVIVGPTGSGKSEAALAVAEQLGGEVVNADSMQMYRGMDIGTAKLPPAQRRGIPHHLLDVLDVTETASVARYRKQAGEVVDALRRDGTIPVIVGGSMMYIQGLIDDWQFPPTDPEVRQRWMVEQDRVGVEALHDRLAAVDPQAAAVIERRDPRRIVRALEVIELTGKPFSATQPDKNRPPRWNARIIGLQAPATWLSPRLEARVQRMFDAGLLTETRGLVERGLVAQSTAGRAIGYSQALAAIAGTMTVDEAQESTVVGTRRYARRQRSWFRRDPRIRWVEAGAPAAVAAVVQLAAEAQAGGV
ncbi:tRNA (adenosine(37)-N6)-dimethylallyltransferase MiaA [Corynebacterium heidelbergense]|uniref:tRNA (adenosine(37)-N6)-dimethylallyltransferase MiaA n=1 Tax=Corynebacterium heidelbergense TaxID=2055947 RepID=UPI001EE698D4|nr:tRNA (adenosine(37)-N6)-dimethylallyltransferase MiaA [Corynebacterium heidelbergense]